MSTESNRLELSVTLGANAFSAAGDTSVVTELYRDFKEAAATMGATGPPSATSPFGAETDAGGQPSGRSHEVQAQHESAEVKAPTKLPLKPYLERLKLPGNKEKAAAIVAWSAESGKKADLKVSEIERLWRESPFKVPRNVPRDVRAAKAEGWLDSDGADGSPNTTYSINGFGEGVVGGWAKSEG